MAILFEQKRSINWAPILFAVFIIGFVAFAVYYLFFAPSPKLDVVLPAPLERIQQISDLTFVDPSEVIKSAAFQKLKPSFGAPLAGINGRPNPFLPL